jgi:3-oxoacyl-[acyl-carrier protein] reductase
MEKNQDQSPPNHDKIIILTGGSRGLGLGIIKYLLDVGYIVATCARTPSSTLTELKRHFPNHFYCKEMDVQSEQDRTNFFEEIKQKFPKKLLYCLINNAGVAQEGILATFPSIDTENLLNINLTSSIEMARLFLRAKLIDQSPGRIINISSIIGQRGYTGLAVYSASKAGLDGLTRALAREVGRREITINSIAPGYLETEMTDILSDKKRQQIINRTPLKRLGTVTDILPAISFLLDSENNFMTGQILTIDGGITC